MKSLMFSQGNKIYIALKFINCKIVTAGDKREPVVKGRVLMALYEIFHLLH